MLTRQRLRFREALSTADWGGRATRVEVDLDSIAWNVAQLKQLIEPAELMPVVKANGYGHGAVAVSTTAVRAGAERLAVYTVDEGVELRRAGLDVPVLTFGPFET